MTNRRSSRKEQRTRRRGPPRGPRKRTRTRLRRRRIRLSLGACLDRLDPSEAAVAEAVVAEEECLDLSEIFTTEEWESVRAVLGLRQLRPLMR